MLDLKSLEPLPWLSAVPFIYLFSYHRYDQYFTSMAAGQKIISANRVTSSIFSFIIENRYFASTVARSPIKGKLKPLSIQAASLRISYSTL